jgi:DNA-binding transcriptional LysR family regulator
MDRVSSMLSFVKVVENGGFSAAGRQLTLATSIVTAHVKSLEERLGVRLLNRSTRSISLTEAGQSYYERCVQILSEIEEAEEAAQVLQARPRGTLRLNISPAVAVCIAPSITEFTSLYPDVSVRLTATTRMVNLVEEGFDLAIRFMAAADSSLILRRLASFRFVVCGSPDYLARRGRPEQPSDLVRHNCLIYYDAPFGKHGREWPFSGPIGDLTVRVSGSLETNSAGGLLAAARLGNGLIFVPSSTVAEDLKSGALVPLLTEFLPTEYSVDALYPHREHLPLKVRAFIDLVANNIRKAKPNAAVEQDISPNPHHKTPPEQPDHEYQVDLLRPGSGNGLHIRRQFDRTCQRVASSRRLTKAGTGALEHCGGCSGKGTCAGAQSDPARVAGH